MAFNRDSSLDISLGTGFWRGGASDGTTLWFVDNENDAAVAYVAATGARDSAKDISLGTGFWTGGVSDGITLWFVEFTGVDDAGNQARAYVAATGARDSAKDISLGTGLWTGGTSDGTTLWFVNNTTNQDEARAYVAATRARDAAKDIALGAGGSWQGGVSDGTTLWFVKGGTDDEIIAYLASDQSRQAADDISHADLGGLLNGGVYANGTAWFVEPDSDTAIAFRQTTPTVDHAVDAGSVAWAFALPQPAVTHILASGHVTQTIQMPAAWYRATAFSKGWLPPTGSRPAIDAGLGGVEARFLTAVYVRAAGSISFSIASSQTEGIGADSDDLTVEFETDGSLEITVGANSLLVALAGADLDEPYNWTPSNSAEAIAFNALLSAVDGGDSGQLIIRDFVPAGPLALADFDDTGLEVETAALLVASAPGTSGNNFYADSSRNGTDSPIEGELGVGPGETRISRMRRASTSGLTLNDNNLPVGLSFGTFFGTGGAGRDLTLYLQTDDGLVSFTVAGAFITAGGNWLSVTLPTAGRTLLDNLATGDRFIFALARAVAATTVDHAVDAGSVEWSFALPQPTVTHTLAPTPALAISDWDGTGYDPPIILALLQATVSGELITVNPVTPIAGELVVANDLTISHVERQSSGENIRLGRAFGSVGISNYFDDEGSPTYPDAELFIVIDNTARTQIPCTIGATGFGFNNWSVNTNSSLIEAIATGDRFLLAIAEPILIIDHAVNAGAVSWAFALPQPTVTHTPASTPILTTTRLFVCDNTGDELWELDPDGADLQGTSRTLPTNLTSPQGMTVFNGRLLVADNTGDELFELDPDGADTQGTKLRDLPGGLTLPTGMTVFNGRLLVADNSGDELWEIDPDGADSQGTKIRDLPFALTSPQGMTVFNGRLLVADGTDGELWEVDPDGANFEGTTLRGFPGALTDLGGMTVFNGRLLAADAAGDELWEIDPDGADTEGTLLRDFPTTLTIPVSMAALDVAAGPTDHAVNAGTVLWAFALPQPRVTHTLAAGTTDHAVNAGAVAWAFHLPQPRVTHSLPARAAIWAQYAITINTNPVTRFWTGRGRLDYLGDLYEGGGRAVGVGEIELVSGNPDRRLTITLSSIPTSVRAEFLQDVGAVEVEVSLIFSADRGSTWRAAPLSYSGRLSSPTMVNGRLTVELETLRGDVDHGETRYWSHEDQERRYPGDKGMEYMRQLAQKGTETSWPP